MIYFISSGEYSDYTIHAVLQAEYCVEEHKEHLKKFRAEYMEKVGLRPKFDFKARKTYEDAREEFIKKERDFIGDMDNIEAVLIQWLKEKFNYVTLVFRDTDVEDMLRYGVYLRN